MAKKPKQDGFNLAFLDVMACGLGAVLLILILVKFNAHSDQPDEETQRLEQELAALADQSAQLQKMLEEVNDNIGATSRASEQSLQQIQRLKVEQNSTAAALNDQLAVVANLEKSVAAAAPKQADDSLSLDGAGEENYLLGLKVEGRQIGILLDKSASMTDEGLIEVIKRKIGSAGQKQAGPKWQRTKRVAKWLLSRLPKTSKVSVVAFSDKAQVLGKSSVQSAGVTANIRSVSQAIDQLIPGNGTNLQAGLKAMVQAMPAMTDLYIITDGLPTLGEQDSSLSSLASCKSLFGKSKTISGECRIKLFNHSVRMAAPTGVRTNIILLPLEGDPLAAAAYWDWSARTQGVFISPAGSWP